MKRYESINGIRTIACLGIILMHVKANISYEIQGDFLNLIINELTNFTLLFMVISAFSMCCGYYNKIKENKISIEDFYSKRFKKILPFFLFLVLINVIAEPSLNSLIEGFTDLTLMFGFIPKTLNIIGVGWFLGLVCIFYMIFPFFVYCISNKKRAWITIIIAIIMNLIASNYFQLNRTNMFFSFVYFGIGGLIYLYKDNIILKLSKYKIIYIAISCLMLIMYFVIPKNNYTFLLRTIVMSIIILVYAISFDSKFLNNKLTKFISELSLEMYLSHMFIFRIIEKLRLTYLVNNHLISYIFTYILVVLGTIIFAFIFKICMKKFTSRRMKNENFISKQVPLFKGWK